MSGTVKLRDILNGDANNTPTALADLKLGELLTLLASADAGAVAAKTAVAPAAMTYAAPGAIAAVTCAAAVGAAPTKAEYDLAVADIVALRAEAVDLRTQLVALAADVTAVRAQVVAAVADLAAIVTELKAGVGATQAGLVPVANVITLAAQPSQVFDVIARTGGTTGTKVLKRGPITGANAVVPATGECVWDGATKILFAAVDAVTSADVLYAKADGSQKVSYLERTLGQTP